MLSPQRPGYFTSPVRAPQLQASYRHPLPYQPQVYRPVQPQYYAPQPQTLQRYPQSLYQHPPVVQQPRFYQPQPQPTFYPQQTYYQPQPIVYQQQPYMFASRTASFQPPVLQPQFASPARVVVKGPQSVVQPPKTEPAPAKEEKKDEDIEKRFEQALERTKKIVEGFPNKPPSQINQQPDVAEAIETQKSEEEPELEDLALQYEDGFIYRGQGIQPQTRCGFGILTDQDENEVYAGFWKDNCYHGQGKLNNLEQEARDEPIDWQDMTSVGNCWQNYDGEFQSGKMHGTGTILLTNGEKYTGEFQEGMVHGQGEFTTMSGDVITGEWDQGLFAKGA